MAQDKQPAGGHVVARISIRRRVCRPLALDQVFTGHSRATRAPLAAAVTRQVPGRARRSEPHVRPWRGVAANPLTLAGLGGALAVGQYRLAAPEDGPRPAGDCPAVVDGVSRP